MLPIELLGRVDLAAEELGKFVVGLERCQECAARVGVPKLNPQLSFPPARVRPHDSLLRVTDRWRSGDDATIDVVIAGNDEHSLYGATARVGEFFEPGESRHIFRGVARERDVATDKDGLDRRASSLEPGRLEPYGSDRAGQGPDPG